MKKKTLAAILSLATGICCLGAFSACTPNSMAWNDVYVNDNGELVITFEDGTEKNLGVVVGKDGKDGIDGIDGKNGIDGVNGNDGIDGVDGKDGINGIDGKNAINIASIASNAVYDENGDIEFTFIFTFDDDNTQEVTCTLKEPVSVSTINLVTPYIESIEEGEEEPTLKLFVTYTDGTNNTIVITEDMIEGNIDFTTKGNYNITITYQGKSENFTVTIY